MSITNTFVGHLPVSFLVDNPSVAWVLVATTLIWIMVPGIGLFYSGMTKRKSALSLFGLTLMAIAVTSFQVCIFAYLSHHSVFLTIKKNRFHRKNYNKHMCHESYLFIYFSSGI